MLKQNIRMLTGIDKLAEKVGHQLRKEFPTLEGLNSFLTKSRQKLLKEIYGSYNCSPTINNNDMQAAKLNTIQ